MRVAVTGKIENRLAPVVRADVRRKPYLTCASLNLVALGTLALRQGRKHTAKLNEIAVAVVPVLQERKIVDDIVDRHGSSRLQI
jgi:hypothetical protein